MNRAAQRIEDCARGAHTRQSASDADIIARAAELLHAEMQRGDAYADPARAGLYMSARLRGLTREVFAVMFLDSRHRLIACEDLFAGSTDGCEVHPREVARRALAVNASAVILGHNHPSGNPDPSAADRAVTMRLKQALALLDVRVLDHFIVGDGPALSMAARGLV
jgi:DNA repair protein RadC